MSDEPDIQRDLATLSAELKRLEAEYNMFFAGRLPRPPWETRSRVEALFKRWDRGYIPGTEHRFRFESLQSRFQKHVDLWDRGLRAREEGRPGPFAQPAPKPEPQAPRSARELVSVTALRDPAAEIEKVQSLYRALIEARRQVGEKEVPFDRFAALVKDQVAKLRAAGSAEVAFRVAVKDGKVNFTVRGVNNPGDET